METPGRAVSTVKYELHPQQETVDFLHAFNFIYVHVHATALKTESSWKVGLLVYCLPEGLGLSAAASFGPLATTDM